MIADRIASMRRRSQLFTALAMIAVIAGVNCIAFLCSAGGYGVVLSLGALAAIFIARR